jgi:hypothetical protein
MVRERYMLIQIYWSIKYSATILASQKCVYVLNMLQKIASMLRREVAVVTTETMVTSLMTMHHEVGKIIVSPAAIRAGKRIACITARGGNARVNGSISIDARHQ